LLVYLRQDLSVSQAGLELLILLLQPPKSWNVHHHAQPICSLLIFYLMFIFKTKYTFLKMAHKIAYFMDYNEISVLEM
jgi:hypothetical protein